MELAKILIVDDREENIFSLETILEDVANIEVFSATSGKDALKLAMRNKFAVILMDVMMPEMDGYQTASLLKVSKKTKNIPIIFVTAIDREIGREVTGYESGAVDFIFKPINDTILLSKVKIFVKLFEKEQLILQKIDELEVANSELKILKEKEIEAEQLRAINALVVTQNHEMNQPLSIVIGGIDLISMMYESNKDVSFKELESQFEKIRLSARKIADLVKKTREIKEVKMKDYVHGTDMLDY